MTNTEAPPAPADSPDAILSAEEHLSRIKHQEAFIVTARDDFKTKDAAAKAAKALLVKAESELHVQIATPEAELPFGEREE